MDRMEQRYARDNTPSFYQFKDKYQLVDGLGRQYMIATKNGQTLQNTRFKNPRPASRQQYFFEPVINNYGLVKLYVKLAERTSQWFKRSDINKPLVLYSKASPQRSFVVELKAHHKAEATRRTGSILVKGIERATLLRLLNQ